jgi:hypothetical protein
VSITFVSATQAATLGSDEFIIDTPAGAQEGDLLLFLANFDAFQLGRVVFPPGWDLVAVRAYSGGVQEPALRPHSALAAKYVTATEAAQQVFTTVSDELLDWRAVITAWRAGAGVPVPTRVLSGQTKGTAGGGCFGMTDIAFDSAAVETHTWHVMLSTASGSLGTQDFCDGGGSTLVPTTRMRSTGQAVRLVGSVHDAAAGSFVAAWNSDGIGGAASTQHAVTLVEGSPPVGGASPRDRYRLSVSADGGSLLAAVEVVPFDASASIAFPKHVRIHQTLAYPVRESHRRQALGPVDAAVYWRATQNSDGMSTFDGLTMLGLMETAFPSQIFLTTSEAGIGIRATARQIIEYVFERWALEFPWFAYAPVPDLRLRVPGLPAPSEYGDEIVWVDVLGFPQPFAGTGVIMDSVIALRQEADNRRNMRQMLDALLSPFPGTAMFQDSTGSLRIVPIYGPDADEVAARVIDESDAVSLSVGAADAFNIYNRATVARDGYRAETGVSVMQPAFVQFLSNHLQNEALPPTEDPEGFLNSVPDDRLDLTIGNGEFGGQREWPIDSDIVLAEDATAIFLDDGGPLVTAQFNIYHVSTGVLSQSPATSVEILSAVPLSGAWVLAARAYTGGSYLESGNFRAQLEMRWDASDQVIRVRWAGGWLERGTGVAQVEFTLNGASDAYVRTGRVTATFGVVDEGHAIPAEDGGNALTQSQDVFGVREARIEIEGYGSLTAVTLLDIAQGFVLQNITPRATREIGLGEKGVTAVTFDHRGRLASTPHGGEGVIIGVEYTDDFLTLTKSKTVRVEETLEGQPGTIDTTTAFLLNDDHTYWQNDDDSLSEPA